MTFCVRLYCSLLVMRPPPRSTLFPTRRSSDLALDFLQVLRREMKSGGVLQQKRAELAGVGQWQDAGAKFIEVALIRRLPLVIGFVSRNFHRVGELLPKLHGKRKVAGCFVRP